MNFKAWSALTLFSIASFASSATSLSNAFYATAEFGGSLAYANQTVNNAVNLNWQSLTFSSSEPYQNHASMVRPSAAGAILLGYGKNWKNINLSGELGVSNAYYKMNSSMNMGLDRAVTFSGQQISVSAPQSLETQVGLSPVQFGIFLRPGIFITPQSLWFMRVGTSFATASSYLNLDVSKIVQQEGANILVLPLKMQAKRSRHVAALQLGTGLEHSLNEHLSFRMDYLFSYYGKLRFEYAGDVPFSQDTLSLTTIGYQSVSINTQSILLGLTYRH